MSELSKLVLAVEILVPFRHKNAEGYESKIFDQKVFIENTLMSVRYKYKATAKAP